ncbi:hypothetical protein OHN73_11335 [Streptomyces sp. NBC_00519]
MRRLSSPAAIRVGDRVRFAGQVRAVLAVSARAVTLAEEDDSPREVPLAVLLGDESFEVLGSPVRTPLPPVSLLEALPEHAREEALWWEGHILEVLHGVDPNADEDAGPRPEYDPARHSLTARERAKAAELTAAGYQVSASTIGNFRRRYQAEGLLGLADRRPVRKKPQFGTVDDAVVEAMRQAIKEGIDDSTRTGTYIIWRTGEILWESSETVELPSQSTLYRLLAKLTFGKPVSATARNRRSRAHGAKTPFGQWPVFAPGEVVQIDSTPLDVLVRLDDGVVGKIELTGVIDVATRTVPAAVLRPTTKSVDASVLLARTLTPEVMRPGWVDALRMSRSPDELCEELAWDHAAQGLPKGTEAEIAEAAAALLTRAHAGPAQAGTGKPKKRTRREKQVAARTKATPPIPKPAPVTEPNPAPEAVAEEEAPLTKVIPLGVFDPLADPWKRS